MSIPILLGLSMFVSCVLSNAPARAGEVHTEVLDLRLPGVIEGLDRCDLDDDGRAELLVARESGLTALWTRPGSDLGRALLEIPRAESRTFAWCTGEDLEGRPALFVLRDGGVVERWSLREKEGTPLLTDRNVLCPEGVQPLHFVRDLRGKGPRDVVLPTADGLALHFAPELSAATPAYRAGPRVRHEVEVTTTTPALELGEELRRSVQIQSFVVKDQNGDGVPDLAFRTEDRVDFFWSDAEGELPGEPTFTIDLAALRASLPKVEEGSLDPQNLLKALDSFVSSQERDLDGDGIVDLLLRQGSKLTVHRGSPAGFDRSKADQVLKSSGNLLSAFATDENRDGKVDLCLLRIADVSLGEILVWLVLGGSLEFELFAYHQEEPMRFSRRPSSQRSLRIEFPALFSIEDELEEPIRRLSEQYRRVPVRGDFDGDGAQDDIAVLDESFGVALHQDVAPPEIAEVMDFAWSSTLERFDRRAADGRMAVGLADLMDWAPYQGRELLDAIEGRTAEESLAGPATLPRDDDEADEWVLCRLSLDREGPDDLVLVQRNAPRTPVRLRIWDRQVR